MVGVLKLLESHQRCVALHNRVTFDNTTCCRVFRDDHVMSPCAVKLSELDPFVAIQLQKKRYGCVLCKRSFEL